MTDEIDFERLWQRVSEQFHGSNHHSVHGPDHWKRVEQNGLLLASRTGADTNVVRLFALFHDSRRLNDWTDNGHGARGAAYAAELRGNLYQLDDAAFRLLEEACIWHTDRDLSDNPTIGTCWDADRLDLERIGVVPHPLFMSTAFGKEIAKVGSIQPFLSK